MKKDLESFMYQLRIKAQVEVIEMVCKPVLKCYQLSLWSHCLFLSWVDRKDRKKNCSLCQESRWFKRWCLNCQFNSTQIVRELIDRNSAHCFTAVRTCTSSHTNALDLKFTFQPSWNNAWSSVKQHNGLKCASCLASRINFPEVFFQYLVVAEFRFLEPTFFPKLSIINSNLIPLPSLNQSPQSIHPAISCGLYEPSGSMPINFGLKVSNI